MNIVHKGNVLFYLYIILIILFTYQIEYKVTPGHAYGEKKESITKPFIPVMRI